MAGREKREASWVQPARHRGSKKQDEQYIDDISKHWSSNSLLEMGLFKLKLARSKSKLRLNIHN